MKFFKKSIIPVMVLFLLFSCKKDDNTFDSPKAVSNISLNNFSSASTVLITAITTSSLKAYKLVSLISKPAYYIDRNYVITAYPTILTGAQLIQTAEADKSINTANFLSFNLTQAATVYVAYDTRSRVLPAWLQSWTKTSSSVNISDPKLSTLLLYSKSFAAGKVSLGGNMLSPSSGALTQYVVFATVQSSTPESSPLSSAFMFGINGHSLGQPSYKSLSALEQVAMLKKMGMTGYRQDIDFNTDGTIGNLSLFTPLYNATKAAGITILPMVYTKTLNYSSSSTASYNAGKILGINVATKNHQYFTYYELGNELDNKVITSGNGDQPSEYNTSKFNVVAAYLKGMNDGIKSVQPDAKTMIDASWLHYAFLQMLISYGVNFDIIAYHWYSEMEGIAANRSLNIPDITKKLSSLFTKPIWFTEVGERYKSISNIDELQTNFLDEFRTKCKNNPQVKSLLLYELLDEPEKNSLLESNYGLTKWMSPFTKWEYKTAGQSFFVN